MNYFYFDMQWHLVRCFDLQLKNISRFKSAGTKRSYSVIELICSLLGRFFLCDCVSVCLSWVYSAIAFWDLAQDSNGPLACRLDRFLLTNHLRPRFSFFIPDVVFFAHSFVYVLIRGHQTTCCLLPRVMECPRIPAAGLAHRGSRIRRLHPEQNELRLIL
jgi:hypothetical protein